MRLRFVCVIGSFAASLLALWLPAPAAAQQDEAQNASEQQRIIVRGFVTDATSGQALPGANVALLEGEQGDLRVVRGAAADGDGLYQLANVAPGRYLLRVSYVGYGAQIDTLRLGERRYVQRNVALMPAEETLEEVTVTEESGAAKVEAGRQRITPADLDRIPSPGPTGDLAGYLQSLPGVVSLGDRGGQLYIRGGAPSQNQVMMDKMLLYRPFHIVGFFSAFPQDLISSVDFYAGGYGARYAQRISSVIDVTMRAGNDQRFGGALALSPFLNSVRVEGPIRKGDISLLVSIRQSAIEETAPTVLGEDLPLRFGEQMFKVQNTGPTGQCSLTGLHTYDRGKIDVERSDVFKWQNYALGGRCLTFSERSPLTTEIDFGVSYFDNEVGGGGGDVAIDTRTSDIWQLYTNIDLARPVGWWDVNGGFRVRARKMNYELQEQYQGLRSDDDFFISFGGYGGAGVSLLGETLDLEPGLALDAQLGGGQGLSLQPRLRAAWRPFEDEKKQFSAAVGLYEQLVTGVSDERDAGSVFTIWTPAPLGPVRPQATHAILGYRQPIGPVRGLDVSVEGYYKHFEDLVVPTWDTNARFTTTLGEARGDSYGLDARATFDRTPFYFYVGYGYSQTRYGLDQAEFGRWFGEPVQEYSPPHDQRHQFNAVASYERGKWQGNVRWQYASGRPYTPPVGFDSFFDLRTLPDVRRGVGDPRFLFERPYGERLPAYHRLDVSLERAFDFDLVDLTVKAGAINVYDRSNLFYFDLFRFRRVDQLPIVPYLSLTLDTL